jgi:hypothetical protein
VVDARILPHAKGGSSELAAGCKKMHMMLDVQIELTLPAMEASIAVADGSQITSSYICAKTHI